jgi:hypothetical protein
MCLPILVIDDSNGRKSDFYLLFTTVVHNRTTNSKSVLSTMYLPFIYQRVKLQTFEGSLFFGSRSRGVILSGG